MPTQAEYDTLLQTASAALGTSGGLGGNITAQDVVDMARTAERLVVYWRIPLVIAAKNEDDTYEAGVTVEATRATFSNGLEGDAGRGVTLYKNGELSFGGLKDNAETQEILKIAVASQGDTLEITHASGALLDLLVANAHTLFNAKLIKDYFWVSRLGVKYGEGSSSYRKPPRRFLRVNEVGEPSPRASIFQALMTKPQRVTQIKKG